MSIVHLIIHKLRSVPFESAKYLKEDGLRKQCTKEQNSTEAIVVITGQTLMNLTLMIEAGWPVGYACVCWRLLWRCSLPNSSFVLVKSTLTRIRSKARNRTNLTYKDGNEQDGK